MLNRRATKPLPPPDPNAPPLASRRGQHPDLDDGELAWDVHAYPNPTERDFNRLFRADEAFRANVTRQAAARQAREHPEVQTWIAGAEFGLATDAHPFPSPYRGLTEYEQTLDRGRRWVERDRYGDGTTVIRATEIGALSLPDFERYFDEQAQPRPGVVVEHDAGVRLDSGMDEQTAAELRRQGGQVA